MFSAAATCVIMMQVTGQRRAGGNHGGRRMHRVGTWLLAPVFAARQQRAVTCAGEGKARGEAGKWGCDHGGSSSHSSACGCGWWWCVLQLFRAPRGRIQPLSQMGQDLQARDRKWLEGCVHDNTRSRGVGGVTICDHGEELLQGAAHAAACAAPTNPHG